MKKKAFLSAILLFLSVLPTEKLSAQLGNRLVSGGNLDIGRNNNIAYHVDYVGNAIGEGNQAISSNTLVVGANDTIGLYSSGSVALGKNNYILGESSMAFGYGARTFRDYSVVIGSGVIGPHGLEAYFDNGNGHSLAVGFNSTRPTLFVSESLNDPENGIIDKTGKVAIGDVSPQAKLHIRSDEHEDAGIILVPAEPNSSNTFIRLRDNEHHVSVNQLGQMSISAGVSNLLGIYSSNFNVVGNKIDLGLRGDRRIFICSDGTPSISSNANPENGEYSRVAEGPAYTLEFGSGTGFRLRTALDELPHKELIDNWRDAFIVKTSGAITLNGRVGVNIENNYGGYALAVNGGILTTKVHIQEVDDWPDYVFDADYRPMATGDLKAYIGEHRHLPGIPSEAEVKAEGYDVVEMQAMLLGKIEELTLHMLRQQDEIDSLRTLVTVHYGYDACGNRISRTIAFSTMQSLETAADDELPDDAARWQASLRDSFDGGDAMLFPNPTEGGFILSLTGGGLSQNTTVTLCTIDGKTVEERTLAGVTEEFDLTGKPAGVYLLRLTSGHETKVWKVVKRN